MAVDYKHFGRTYYLHLQGGNEPSRGSRMLYSRIRGNRVTKNRRVGRSARNRGEETRPWASSGTHGPYGSLAKKPQVRQRGRYEIAHFLQGEDP
jgi:hypothetical protein